MCKNAILPGPYYKHLNENWEILSVFFHSQE